jgi:ComF family protein
MILRGAFLSFLDFLYPKSAKVYELEALTPYELLERLPPAKDLGDDVIALFSYADEGVRELIWELKYRNNAAIARTLAALLWDVLQTELAERALSENFERPLLVPVPMSKKRRLMRGWNQTETLCEELKKLDTENILEYKSDLLLKARHTESQTLTANKKERLHNLEGTMEVSGDLKGKCVVVVDDVTTTGATFAEARRELRRGGARKVFCVALAH